MQIRALVKDAPGLLALALMIALASPGVQVSAEPPAESLMSIGQPAGFAGLAEPAGSCSVGAPKPPSNAEISAYVRQQLIRQALAQQGDGEPVRVLNGRGYNYERPRNPMAELALLRAEAEQDLIAAPAQPAQRTR